MDAEGSVGGSEPSLGTDETGLAFLDHLEISILFSVGYNGFK